jgi:hypothetical protein
MNDARASRINAKQGTVKAVNTSKLGQQNKQIPVSVSQKKRETP